MAQLRHNNDDGFPIAFLSGYDDFLENVGSGIPMLSLVLIGGSTNRTYENATIPVHEKTFYLHTEKYNMLREMETTHPTTYGDVCVGIMKLMVASRELYDYFNMIIFHNGHFTFNIEFLPSCAVKVTIFVKSNVRLKHFNCIIDKKYGMVEDFKPRSFKDTNTLIQRVMGNWELEKKYLFPMRCGDEGWWSPLMSVALNNDDYNHFPHQMYVLTSRITQIILELLNQCRSVAIIINKEDGYHLISALSYHNMDIFASDVYPSDANILGIVHVDLVISVMGVTNSHIFGNKTLNLYYDNTVLFDNDIQVLQGYSGKNNIPSIMCQVDEYKPNLQKIVIPIAKTEDTNLIHDQCAQSSPLYRYLCGEAVGLYKPPNVDNIPECPVCMEKLTHPITVVSCGHKFCQSCLNSWLMKENKRTCPTCRSEVETVDAPKPNSTCTAPLLVRCIMISYLMKHIMDGFKQGVLQIIQVPSEYSMETMFKSLPLEYKFCIFKEQPEMNRKSILAWKNLRNQPTALIIPEDNEDAYFFFDDVEYDLSVVTNGFSFRNSSARVIRHFSSY